MKYENVVMGIFKERKNRFIALVEINGTEQECHVKNTGRLRELLVLGAEVGLEVSDNPSRKTKYDVISVKNGDEWINIDSQAPNIAAKEWLTGGGLGEISFLKPEQSYISSDNKEKSRFDFYVEFDSGKRKGFVEVKGVTLKEDGVALFPDAPTERGVRHLKTLLNATKCGYEAYVLFVIQMKGVKKFSPNSKMHLEFAETLKTVRNAGVNVLAVDCVCKIDAVAIDKEIDVVL